MRKVLLSGNEAIARGAMEAGVKVVTGYPGTPSTDILESITGRSIYKEWSSNEKVAYEIALGASLMNVRAMVVMKNAGVNWIMDSLTATTYTGIRGGLVIAVADDPGAHFSVTEQDSRGLAYYLKIPCVEPSDQQEAKDMARKAFEISEELELPVMLRTVSKIAHTVSPIKLDSKVNLRRVVNFKRHYKRPYRWNPYAPPRPVADHKWLLNTLEKQKQISEESEFNKLIIRNKRIGIITSGVAFSYVSEATNGRVNILKISFAHPIPEKLVLRLIEASKKVFVIEEGDSIIENQVRLITDKEIYSRKKRYGELDVDEVKNTLFL